MQPFFDIERVPVSGATPLASARSFDRRLPVTPVTPTNRILTRPAATIPVYSRYLFNFNTNGLPLHFHPNETSPRALLIPFGARVTVIQDGFPATPQARGGWALVVFAGRQGYASKQWLAANIPHFPESASHPLQPTPEMTARYDIIYHIWNNRLDYGRFNRPYQRVQAQVVTMDQVREVLTRLDPCYGVYRDRGAVGSGWYNIQTCEEIAENPGTQALEGFPHTQQAGAIVMCLINPFDCAIVPI